MCGIAGIIGRLDDANRAALSRMNAAMVHRGPDGGGSFESTPDISGRGVMLTHRRLAILDLSSDGAQPMVDPVTGHVIAFNGEIYNFQELRHALTAQGQEFQSSGDTAVLLRLLGVSGAGALPRLRGMFAFAAFDPARRRLLLARDPLGIKPLYLMRSNDPAANWTLAFASELRTLLASHLLGVPRLDPRGVASYIWNGFVVGPSTAVKGIALLCPGQMMEFDCSGVATRDETFWSAAPCPPLSGKAPLDEQALAATMQETLRLHLASDVPLAVFLSGGIDSSAIANLAQQSSARPIHTFTLAFEEQELNEGPFARAIAAAIGTCHHEVMLTQGDFSAMLEAALDSLDQPSFDGINAYVMSRAIRGAGFTVALSGTGGDELFGGYPTFRELPRLQRLLHQTAFIPPSLRAALAAALSWPLRRSAQPVPPQTRWAKLPDMARRGDDLLGLYQLAYALFLPDFQNALLPRDRADVLEDGLPARLRIRVGAEISGRSALSAISVLEQRLFLGERLLRDNDAASMAASLEQRVPLVDRVLFETLDRLPDDRRFEPLGRKDLLRRFGLRGLDPALFERPKSGFVLPFDRWIRGSLRTRMDQTLRDRNAVRPTGLNPEAVARLWQAFLAGAPGMYWSRIWSIYVFIRWCHRHQVFR